MPAKRGYTTKGGDRVGYYQWGNSGKKYYYTPGSERSRKRAKTKAQKQGQAIKANS